jgi:hypothetical protein
MDPWTNWAPNDTKETKLKYGTCYTKINSTEGKQKGNIKTFRTASLSKKKSQLISQKMFFTDRKEMACCPMVGTGKAGDRFVIELY